ncbi:unnamed protein product [Lactuca virosa]|uniref:Uncharacterized protein n=1 Tax=Lactuca virosa TaxID=75947 RepID=A0AAU9M8U3_9ASTR|nr:unnamed protein product [Lactuca virosa]
MKSDYGLYSGLKHYGCVVETDNVIWCLDPVFSYLPPISLSPILFKTLGDSPLPKFSSSSSLVLYFNVQLMAANEELKVEVEQVQVTSPSSGSFRCRLHRTPSGIQRTKSINYDAKAIGHNENGDMKTVIAP